MGEKILQEICSMLDTYTGRDKIVRTLCYTTKLVSAIQAEKGNDDLSKKFAIFSTKMSQTRANLRLFDDIPMIQYTKEYGWGDKEPDQLMAVIGVLTNVIDHLYYPVDKICWLIEQKIIESKKPERWDTINSILWVSSIYLNLMKTIRLVQVMRLHRESIDKVENENSVALNKLEAKERMEKISILRLTLDFVHAASTLPHGWLWGGKFSNLTVGAIGSTSSLIGLYQYFAKKKLARN
ncbi:CLUMA_CG008128, isoform A [Clunio marinus]|uniref:CLUMA_CG008128, isoform A n=1 Tax=Clunio marinus TaxID=568069 RepID=A0A1J1I4V8_9DIPT|nr:CLUMA_CG008128, isoform A [Clunio marinus]